MTYLIPAFAAFWGWSVLGERLEAGAVPGLALIVAGVWLLNRRGSAAPRAAPA